MLNTREKLIEVIRNFNSKIVPYYAEEIADKLIANGVTVQEWIPASEPPKEPGEYIVAQKHWSDGHLETKKGKWNGVEWLVDGRESLRVAYWMPMPEPPKGE